MGSPLIFIEELRKFAQEINVKRAVEGMKPIAIDCLLIFNDESADAIEVLKTLVAPLEVENRELASSLHLKIEYLNNPFEQVYRVVKDRLRQGRYSNVLFNLDQCGHTDISIPTLADIMHSYMSVEIFYTFAIQSLIAFLQKSNPEILKTQLSPLGITDFDLQSLQSAMSRNEWLGAAERLVFEALQTCAPYVSPFSINNPDGWRYWLIHFANSYRAREVYNNILHENSSMQAHFGRSGLNMLSYDPSHNDGRLYLFDDPGREIARSQLLEDIPRVVSESGDAIGVGSFYESIYNRTPAHTDDIRSAIANNPDIVVLTPFGGERRKANTIKVNDVLKLKAQKSFLIFDVKKSDKT